MGLVGRLEQDEQNPVRATTFPLGLLFATLLPESLTWEDLQAHCTGAQREILPLCSRVTVVTAALQLISH